MRKQIFEAIQWNGDADLANKFFGDNYGVDWKYYAKTDEILVPVQNGKLHISPGLFVIKENGQYSNYHQEEFDKRYCLNN